MRQVTYLLTLILLLALLLTSCTDDTKKDPTDTGGGMSSAPSESVASYDGSSDGGTTVPEDGVELPKVEF